MHVLIDCLLARKGGFDGIGQSLQSAMASLTLNNPYNFSRYIFQAMKTNILVSPIPKRNIMKFLLFPRFVQLFLNAQVPNLPTDEMLLPVTQMLKRTITDSKNYGRSTPDDVPLFGHIINPDYVAPSNDNWLDEQEEHPAQQQQQSVSPPPAEEDVEPENVNEQGADTEVVKSDTDTKSDDDTSEDLDTSVASKEDDVDAILTGPQLAALQRIANPVRRQQLQQADRSKLSQRSSRRRDDDDDADFELELQPLAQCR